MDLVAILSTYVVPYGNSVISIAYKQAYSDMECNFYYEVSWFSSVWNLVCVMFDSLRAFFWGQHCLMKLKNSNCNKTQKLIVIKLKNSNCDETRQIKL